MVRSMYSGVAGMRAQQTAMDTIGNNIANVRTYGYKASRTTFKDVYYQTMKSGSGGTASRGGTNGTQIGYGAQLGTVDVLHGQSSFSMTGRSLDSAIAGEGFFQVQDSAGNIFYTRAGILDFDPSGNLVDSNGYFVLGTSGDPLGRGGSSEKIQMAIPPVAPGASKVTETINNAKITITGSNNTDAGDVSFTFQEDDDPIGGVNARAILTGGGSGITIKLNPNATFTTQADLQNAINQAITAANGGVAHPAGNFTVGIEPAATKWPAGGLTGKQISSKDYSVVKGVFTGSENWGTQVFGGMRLDNVGDEFTLPAGNTGRVSFDQSIKVVGPPAGWQVTMDVGGKKYVGLVENSAKDAGKFMLKANPATTAGDTITLTHPGATAMTALAAAQGTPDSILGVAAGPLNTNATASTASKNLGLSSKAIKLTGGTEGGPQGIENVESISVGADGIITAKHAVHGEIPVGRVDLVTFANPAGLMQAGNTTFSTGPNSGKINITAPGKNGAGSLATGSLEQSSVDLSQEFSEMITTQRAYQANSRMITVSDTMLEELVNLKR